MRLILKAYVSMSRFQLKVSTGISTIYTYAGIKLPFPNEF